jgi:hypothetical protein
VARRWLNVDCLKIHGRLVGSDSEGRLCVVTLSPRIKLECYASSFAHDNSGKKWHDRRRKKNNAARGVAAERCAARGEEKSVLVRKRAPAFQVLEQRDGHLGFLEAEREQQMRSLSSAVSFGRSRWRVFELRE